jgi:hypothetical protein
MDKTVANPFLRNNAYVFGPRTNETLITKLKNINNMNHDSAFLIQCDIWKP